jgi:hypothetical protein
MKILTLSLIFIFCNTVLNAQIDTEKYLWEYPLQRDLVMNEELLDELSIEMQKIIDNGDLFFRPLATRYSDQVFEHYSIYQEPGRVLNTIALAYPYLNSDQQDYLRTMVGQLLADNTHAPWSIAPLSQDAGAARDLYESDVIWGLNSDFGLYRPTIQNVYNLWKYVYRTGDTASVQPYYNTIRSFYDNKVAMNTDPGNMYGTMSSHIGMARLAEMFGDNNQVITASNNLNNFLTLGLDIGYVDSWASNGSQGWNAPYGSEYDSRKDNWVYRGYIFLNLSPEIGRFLQDSLLEEISDRHFQGINRFPFWWLRQSPYFTRWTGDEGVGLPTEMMGMIVPVERWVMNRGADTLASYMISSPIGIADCYWLEALVYALESDSEDEWVDVRDTPFGLDLYKGYMVWTGTVSSDWFDPENWDIRKVPGEEDIVVINIAPNKPVIYYNTYVSIKKISLNPGAEIEIEGILEVIE